MGGDSGTKPDFYFYFCYYVFFSVLTWARAWGRKRYQTRFYFLFFLFIFFSVLTWARAWADTAAPNQIFSRMLSRTHSLDFLFSINFPHKDVLWHAQHGFLFFNSCYFQWWFPPRTRRLSRQGDSFDKETLSTRRLFRTLSTRRLSRTHSLELSILFGKVGGLVHLPSYKGTIETAFFLKYLRMCTLSVPLLRCLPLNAQRDTSQVGGERRGKDAARTPTCRVSV